MSVFHKATPFHNQRFLSTPAGRAETWVKGLAGYIQQAETESRNLTNGGCGLPKNLAKEYASFWDSKATSVKATLEMLQKILDREEKPEDFESKVTQCEKDLKSFKDDMQRCKTLCRSYKKQ